MPTSEETDDARERLIDQLESGIQSSSKEDMRLEAYDPAKQLDVIERLERRAADQTAAGFAKRGLFMTKLVPPGCG